MSTKMDGYSARTVADLERRYGFGRAFSEVMGVAKDAQTHAIEAEKIAKEIVAGTLDIKVVEKINVSSDTLILKNNRLVIDSTNFKLSEKGVITAKEGNISNWRISATGIEKLTNNFWLRIDAPDSSIDDFITIAKIQDGAVTDVPLTISAKGDITSKGNVFFNGSGEIGGWEFINSVANGKPNCCLRYYDDTTGRGTGLQPPNSGTYAIAVNFTNINNWSTARFSVDHEGVMRSKNATGSMSTTIKDGEIFIDGEWKAQEEHMRYQLMKFKGIDDKTYGLFAYGYWDVDDPNDPPDTGPLKFIFTDVAVSLIS